MNDRRPSIPDHEAHTTPQDTCWNTTQGTKEETRGRNAPLSSRGDNRIDVVSGFCQILLLQLGHRPLRSPCGQRLHALHPHCKAEALARGVTRTPLRYPAINRGAQRPRWDALAVAV